MITQNNIRRINCNQIIKQIYKRRGKVERREKSRNSWLDRHEEIVKKRGIRSLKNKKQSMKQLHGHERSKNGKVESGIMNGLNMICLFVWTFYVSACLFPMILGSIQEVKPNWANNNSHNQNMRSGKVILHSPQQSSNKTNQPTN